MRMAVAIAIILNENGETLMQKKDLGYEPSPGSWCLFGGHVEPGEKPEDALVRELTLEELVGIKIENLRLYKKTTYETGKEKEAFDLYIYVCNFYGNLSDLSLGEGAGFAFVNSKEIYDLKIKEPELSILKEFYRLRGLL